MRTTKRPLDRLLDRFFSTVARPARVTALGDVMWK
jgi:hypothetical protein